jgi:ABC-type multidrug transport system ATPase subunit
VSPERHTAASLQARGIRRAFGEHLVLDGIDLVREAPGVVGLVGPNGSGKTTLLRIVAQLVEPDAGTLRIGALEVERGDHAAARAAIGWVPHTPLAWRVESVETNLRQTLRLAGWTKAHATQRADEVLEAWALEPERTTAVMRLSRGWQQRYSLARAELLTPPVLLLDEPTTGLDDAACSLLDAAIERWRSDRVVIVSSHDRAWLDARCDELLDLSPVALDGAHA